MADILETLRVAYATYGDLLNFVLVNAILALSMYLTLSCGLFTMANAAFMGIGAYTSALLVITLGWPMVLTLACGTLAAALIAVPLGWPALRLQGIYLAMATIAFGEVVRIAFLNLPITGGARGLPRIPAEVQGWHLILVLILLVYFFERLRGSRTAHAISAIRDDPVAAAAAGVNVTYYRTLTFVVGAGVAGLAGGLSAHLTRFIAPGDFGFARAVEVLVFAIVGGTGTHWGALVGAAVMTLLPELLRFLREWRLIVSGVVLLAVMLFLPGGVVGLFGKRGGRGGLIGSKRVSTAGPGAPAP